MDAWNGRQVLVLGAARQGIALARWLCKHEAVVTLSDVQTEAALPQARAALADLPIRWALGGHPLSLLDEADTLCLSGGVPADLPIVREARRRGVTVTNDTQIFMERAPCKTVGITGSAGKTTTTAMVGEMAKIALQDRQEPGVEKPVMMPKAYIGGNIGDPLLNHVDQMTAGDLAILEVSSFQLEQMTISPNVAAVLNITPNHLDRHGTMAAYTAAKARLIDFQTPDDCAVLGHDDPGCWELRQRVKGELQSFGLTRPPADLDGTYFEDGMLHLVDRGVPIPLLRREQIQLRGRHNLLNALAAFSIGHAAGFPLDAMLSAATSFRGVPHRLQLVRVLNGTSWYDDSIATAPERVMAAVQSFDEPIILLLGGRDKKLPWNELARLICERVDHVVLFGEAASMIESEIRRAQETQNAAPAEATQMGSGSPRPYSLQREHSLREAVAVASRLAEPGDVVLLAPGGTSFDEFKDFEERGARFESWVKAL